MTKTMPQNRLKQLKIDILSVMFRKRSLKLERIDTGDYTSQEYEVCLSELSFINRWIGDTYALRRTLLHDIGKKKESFSVLDVGAGSGELLREIANFAAKNKQQANLVGLDYNHLSAQSIISESKGFKQISALRGTGFSLPFADESFDYVICSLFTHHFSDEEVVRLLAEMKRVSRAGIYVVDLHRHPIAYALYKVFCMAFRISKLVREDGSLSVLRGFKPSELRLLGKKAGLENIAVNRFIPYRLVLKGK